ncbi:hypothetical protein FKM82_025769 [Ascaphus truei]
MSHASSQPGMSEDLKKLQQEMNVDNTKEVDFFLLLDNLLAQEVHGFPCALKQKSQLQRTERRVIDIVSYVMGPSNREVLRLSVGTLLHTLQANMLEVTTSRGGDVEARYCTEGPCYCAAGLGGSGTRSGLGRITEINI